MQKSRIIVTGAAGFIGFHLCRKLLGRGDEVIGIDNVNAYYDVKLKEARLDQLFKAPGFRWHKHDLKDRDTTASLIAEIKPDKIVHLAPQAGVRYSLTQPH
jgi:UDP-glucuronate 4-epimerase